MTLDEARHLIIDGRNYAAYRETGSLLESEASVIGRVIRRAAERQRRHES